MAVFDSLETDSLEPRDGCSSPQPRHLSRLSATVGAPIGSEPAPCQVLSPLDDEPRGVNDERTPLTRAAVV